MIRKRFIDRKIELNEIKKTLDNNNFEFTIIYGRRRIGKTRLILEAIANKPHIYYLATEENNLRRFHNIASKTIKDAIKIKEDWEFLFDYLKDKIDIIVIDEFQNMIKENKKIISLFQSIVDNILVNSKLKLFLLGSSVSIINSKILSYSSPLYGRRTGTIKLRTLNFFDLKKFFPKANIEQLVDIYAFADGIPYYLEKIQGNFWEWLDKELHNPKSFIEDEVNFLMRYEFEDSSTYKSILEAIANGKTKLNEIKNFIGVKRTDITPYLKNLIETEFILRKVPITERTISRKGRYYIRDNFIAFWFKFIYPNLSFIEEGIFDVKSIKKYYSNYLGLIFEKICVQYLLKKIKQNPHNFPFNKIGKWWYKDKEIDIVATNEQTKQILFAECKWKDKVNAEKILVELKNKATYVKWNNNERKEYYAIFAKSFSKKVKDKNIFCYDLKDLEKIMK